LKKTEAAKQQVALARLPLPPLQPLVAMRVFGGNVFLAGM
jgi:hypothetical protein